MIDLRGCSLALKPGPQDQAAVDRLKAKTAADIMGYALAQGWPVRVLVQALLESAASAFASAVVLDTARRVLCSQTDEAHLEALGAQLREAAERQLREARRELLTNLDLVAPAPIGRPS